MKVKGLQPNRRETIMTYRIVVSTKSTRSAGFWRTEHVMSGATWRDIWRWAHTARTVVSDGWQVRVFTHDGCEYAKLVRIIGHKQTGDDRSVGKTILWGDR